MRSDALIARHETLRLPGGRSIAYRDFPGPLRAEADAPSDQHGDGAARRHWVSGFAHPLKRVLRPSPAFPRNRGYEAETSMR